ncbi:MAG: hydroxyphenylacetyl-CoA thioesterase PaaI [Flavobacteriaceae bacterium]|nr:hydroxyphenylacetyl-CoA thioesterase PaaI [Bacteroidia bacterium]NNF75580.1 hydroxyphenylacetyl-CoA thioesterase PaaI [Flavobacteriaceae bacterium]NNK73595.1 hydroxyphenylacetyl-CoA thioesterase PaaI [Flavobacteriaceae bacterium]
MEAKAIVNKMYENDAFSQWLGIRILEIRPGYSRLLMTVRADMLNGFDLAHGGITYSLADSALAFASNSQGRQAVSVETSINHLEKLNEGTEIEAEAIEVSLKKTIGFYRIEIKTKEKLVAVFNGTVYRTNTIWE